uniref:Polyprotein n=1 Tax=Solanum tuberosum TaxID=4113 RepID=M1DYV0_SOLTU
MALFNHITLAALATQPASIRPRESLFVNAKLNGKDVRIMVDTGATHNFVTKERATDLCLNYVVGDTMLKTVNALPTTVHGFTPKVPIGGQTGRAQIFITPPAVDKQIEAIIDHQLVRSKGWNNSSSQFLIHWKGTAPEEATWEKYEDLWQFRNKVHSYLQVCGAGVVAKSGGGACTTPEGVTLKSSVFGSGAESSGFKQRTDFIPSFGDILETLDEHVVTMTFSQQGPRRRDKAA